MPRQVGVELWMGWVRDDGGGDPTVLRWAGAVADRDARPSSSRTKELCGIVCAHGPQPPSRIR